MSTQRHYEREREREFQISNLTQRESHQRCEGESKDKIPVCRCGEQIHGRGEMIMQGCGGVTIVLLARQRRVYLGISF